MSDKLQPATPAVVPNSDTPTTINLPGDGNTLIAHANVVNSSSITNVIVAGQHTGGIHASASGALNREYYNLFVMGGETFSAFSSGHFLVPKDRALTECVSPDIKTTVSSFDVDTIEFLKTLPAIFMSENESYARFDDTQQAYFGIVNDVRVQMNGIKICYQALNAIPQRRLVDLMRELDILGRPSFSELSRTHWAIKHVNLVEELRDAGITVFAP